MQKTMIDLSKLFEEAYSREHVKIIPDVESADDSRLADLTKYAVEQTFSVISTDPKYASYDKFINAAFIFSKSAQKLLASAIADKSISDQQISKQLGFEYKFYGDGDYHPNGHDEALACIEAKKQHVNLSNAFILVISVNKSNDVFRGKNSKQRQKLRKAIAAGKLDPNEIEIGLSTPCNNCHHMLNKLGCSEIYFTAKCKSNIIKLQKISDTEKNRRI